MTAAINIVEIPGQRLIDGSDINTIITAVNALAAGTGTGTYTGTFNGVVGGVTPAAGTFTTLTSSSTTGLGATTVTGAFTQTTGAIVLNNGATDNDFTAKKLTSGNWLAYDAGTDALLANAATVGITGATTITGAITGTGGNNVFNNGAGDYDFTVKKNTSGNAISFDAGTVALALDATTVGITGALTITGATTATDSITMSAIGKGVILKRGSNGKVGTFVANGATPVSVSNTSIAITDAIIISLNTVGGTVGVQPHVATITAGVGFDVVCTASDTSTYNYTIISNAA